jgi:hypothetical protein
MRRTPLLGVAAALCLLFATTACGSDGGDSGGDTREDMVDELSATLQDDDNGLSDDDADCVAGVIVDEVGVDKLKDVDLSADTPPEELQEEITAAWDLTPEECDIPAVSDG